MVATNRRDFLTGAGVVFTGCALFGQTATARRKVRVANREVRTIDIHGHVIVPEATALLGINTSPTDASVVLPDRLRKMDEWGLDMQALSINANWYAAPREVAEKVIQIQNEKLAALCSQYPDRFVAFASVALQFPELAAQQLEEGIRKYNLRGAAIGGHVNGDELSSPKFDVFWKKAEELGCLIFMHPQGIPEMEKRLAGRGGLSNVIGNPLETTIFLSHLIFDGTLDRFPGLKICAAHGGGFLASYANRSDAVIRCFPDRVGPLPKKNPTAYLRDGQLFFDTIVFTPEALRHLIAETGVSQIMVGTDYPFPWTSTEVDLVLNTPGLTDADRIAILNGTASKLLGIPT